MKTRLLSMAVMLCCFLLAGCGDEQEEVAAVRESEKHTASSKAPATGPEAVRTNSQADGVNRRRSSADRIDRSALKEHLAFELSPPLGANIPSFFDLQASQGDVAWGWAYRPDVTPYQAYVIASSRAIPGGFSPLAELKFSFIAGRLAGNIDALDKFEVLECNQDGDRLVFTVRFLKYVHWDNMGRVCSAFAFFKFPVEHMPESVKSVEIEFIRIWNEELDVDSGDFHPRPAADRWPVIEKVEIDLESIYWPRPTIDNWKRMSSGAAGGSAVNIQTTDDVGEPSSGELDMPTPAFAGKGAEDVPPADTKGAQPEEDATTTETAEWTLRPDLTKHMKIQVTSGSLFQLPNYLRGVGGGLYVSKSRAFWGWSDRRDLSPYHAYFAALFRAVEYPEKPTADNAFVVGHVAGTIDPRDGFQVIECRQKGEKLKFVARYLKYEYGDDMPYSGLAFFKFPAEHIPESVKSIDIEFVRFVHSGEFIGRAGKSDDWFVIDKVKIDLESIYWPPPTLKVWQGMSPGNADLETHEPPPF